MKRIILIICILNGLLLAKETNKQINNIYHLYPHDIEQMENAAYASFIEKEVKKANQIGAEAIIVEINTPGGELAATFKIKDILLSSNVPTICYVNTHAISAGSLIALSCNKLYMRHGSVIGAATVIQMGKGGTQKASEKFQSAARAAWRAAAQANGKNPEIAEAFVDEKLILTKARHGIHKPAGVLLTLTGKEAKRLKMADGLVGNFSEILKIENLSGKIISVEPSFIAKFWSFFLNPMVSGILIGLGFLGLVYELKVPGWGIPGSLGLLFITIYFVSRILTGSAGWGAPALFGLGFLLIVLEIFVIPGFGIAGVSGLFASIAGILWAYGINDIVTGMWVTSLSLLVTTVFIILSFRWLPKFASKDGGGLFINTILKSDSDDPNKALHLLVGKVGVARSVLRPSGLVEIDGERIDAISNGDYIETGEKVLILSASAAQVVVKRLSEQK